MEPYYWRFDPGAVPAAGLLRRPGPAEPLRLLRAPALGAPRAAGEPGLPPCLLGPDPLAFNGRWGFSHNPGLVLYSPFF